MDRSEQIIEITEKFIKALPTDFDRARYLGSVAGVVKLLADFILEKFYLKYLPRETQYSLAQDWNAFALIICPNKMMNGISYNEGMDKYFNSSDLDEKFVVVVKQLYQICKDNKLL